MALTDLPIPPRPEHFSPAGAPPGVALQLDAYEVLNDGTHWLDQRPPIAPRVAVVHTNAASREGNLASQINWGKAGLNNTKPHYCLNAPQPTKVMPTNLRAIANSTASSIEQQYGERDSSFWTIAIESADMGTIAAGLAGYAPGDLGPFLYDHAEILARILAYEAIVWGFPVEVPSEWNSEGVVAHTWPFPYPYFTTQAGKTCPGATKIRQLTDEILPRAQQIHRAWTAPAPTPEEDPMLVIRPEGYADQFLCVPIDSPSARRKFGIPDEQAPVVVKADAAEIEAQIPYKLSYIGR